MDVDDIRVFIPCKDYAASQSFYQALGFKMDYVTDDLSLFKNGGCAFFLQRFYNEQFAKNLMLQLSVTDINVVFEEVKKLHQFNIKFEPIKTEPWGKVIYLWGPAGELWHITEFS